MDERNEELSHEEVWDDSALIESWNQALDEYKKYHSIHAKGGSLQDLEKAVSSRLLNHNSSAKATEATENSKTTAVKHEPAPSEGEQVPPPSTGPAAGLAPPPGPQALLGTVRDENLKKLLMAWYYAGYYTGLYEGQLQAHQDDDVTAPQR
ncbi:Survival motor neuron-like protein-like protein [Hapsidospora chrysogenum ATCC 11550]|uniref:Survival motor neuron-like protein-like protein n=1 Tax=Hapsidospora chrysogenum (strain ATCC 11550 / CBS 779.69 / DSM 880 / IAM 14645 / JCM 23072 / IMI 49137) TaxID=857340 RepID=A0A086TFS3_HAPC1|nr:Survival motor neuron-like protein-like protein [Hapsidospora chrysogenum ATCC 11550]